MEGTSFAARLADGQTLTVNQTKCKQAKTEAGTTQNGLQKEITGLRDNNRTLQARLRDIEVSNDDMERQARHTTSSLEDLDSKYNIAIERGVLSDEEIRNGEQERESLRIEAQRLRDELSDLKIEAELRQDRLHKAEALAGRHPKEVRLVSEVEIPRPASALSEFSPTTSTSSPTVATPQTKSASSTVSETQTPPSPPTSDKSGSNVTALPKTMPHKPRPRPSESNITPRPPISSRLQRYSRGPYVSSTNEKTIPMTRTRNTKTPVIPQRPGNPAQSSSLYHLHGLMNKMQSLEQRVHSVRSKLPAPTSTPPRASPRSGSALGQSSISSNVTVRSSKKRSAGSNASSILTLAERPGSRLSSSVSGLERPSSRLSTGIPQPSPSREAEVVRPPSRDPYSSRPGSRASHTSRQSISHLPNASIPSTSRPSSRQSMSGARTPLGHYPVTSQTEPRRPRSSLGGSTTNNDGPQNHFSNTSRMSNFGSHLQQTDEEDMEDVTTPTPSRRTTFNKDTGPAVSSFSSKQQRTSTSGLGRRTSSGTGEMGPPGRKPARKLSEVGESY